MSELVLFCLATIGFTLIVVDGSIFAPIRESLADRSLTPLKTAFLSTIKDPLSFFKNLSDCYQCSGVWVGWFWAWVFGWDYVPMFAAGFASSFLSLVGAYVLNYLEAKTT